MENPIPAKPRKYLFTLKHYIKDSKNVANTTCHER